MHAGVRHLLASAGAIGLLRAGLIRLRVCIWRVRLRGCTVLVLIRLLVVLLIRILPLLLLLLLLLMLLLMHLPCMLLRSLRRIVCVSWLCMLLLWSAAGCMFRIVSIPLRLLLLYVLCRSISCPYSLPLVWCLLGTIPCSLLRHTVPGGLRWLLRSIRVVLLSLHSLLIILSLRCRAVLLALPRMLLLLVALWEVLCVIPRCIRPYMQTASHCVWKPSLIHRKTSKVWIAAYLAAGSSSYELRIRRSSDRESQTIGPRYNKLVIMK